MYTVRLITFIKDKILEVSLSITCLLWLCLCPWCSLEGTGYPAVSRPCYATTYLGVAPGEEVERVFRFIQVRVALCSKQPCCVAPGHRFLQSLSLKTLDGYASPLRIKELKNASPLKIKELKDTGWICIPSENKSLSMRKREDVGALVHAGPGRCAGEEGVERWSRFRTPLEPSLHSCARQGLTASHSPQVHKLDRGRLGPQKHACKKCFEERPFDGLAGEQSTVNEPANRQSSPKPEPHGWPSGWR